MPAEGDDDELKEFVNETCKEYATLFPEECDNMKARMELGESPETPKPEKFEDIKNIVDEINTTIMKRDKIGQEFDTQLMNIGIQPPFEKVKEFMEKLESSFNNFKQTYIANMDSFGKDQQKYLTFEKFVQTIETNMNASVAQTVKYDEIKILVETGSYTVEQSRHLNAMESLFTQRDEDQAKARLEDNARKQVGKEFVDETRAEMEKKKPELEKEVEKNLKEQIASQLRENPLTPEIEKMEQQLTKIEEKLDKLSPP
jgi:hypothetical protein